MDARDIHVRRVSRTLSDSIVTSCTEGDKPTLTEDPDQQLSFEKAMNLLRVKRRFMLLPGSPVLVVWEIISVTFLAYTALFLPCKDLWGRQLPRWRHSSRVSIRARRPRSLHAQRHRCFRLELEQRCLHVGACYRHLLLARHSSQHAYTRLGFGRASQTHALSWWRRLRQRDGTTALEWRRWQQWRQWCWRQQCPTQQLM